MAKKQEETRAKESEKSTSVDTQGIGPEFLQKLGLAEARIRQLESELKSQSLELVSALSQPDVDCAYLVGEGWQKIVFRGSLKDASYQGHLRNLDDTSTTLVLTRKGS